MYTYPQQPQQPQPQQQQQQQESSGSYGPPPPLPSPYPSVQSYIPPLQAALYASGDGRGTSVPQYGNSGNIAAGAAGLENSQYYRHNTVMSIGQGHPYQSGTDNLQRPNFISPSPAQHNGSGAESITSYGAGGETGSSVTNPWVSGQQTQLAQQNYVVASSAINGWGKPTSAIAPTAVSATETPASATVPYEPQAFATTTPRPASYNQVPSSNAFTSAQPPNPWSSSMAAPYGHSSGNSSMTHGPPPLPPRPPSALNYHTDSSTLQTSSPIQRKPVSLTSADDGGNVQSPTATSTVEPQGTNSTTTTPFTGNSPLPSLPPRYSIGLQQMVPLPPPPPLPPSQYHHHQQQQQYWHQQAQISPPTSTTATIKPHQQNPQAHHQPSSASSIYSQQPVHPQNPANQHLMQATTIYSEGSYPQNQQKLHHRASGYAYNQPAQQYATPIQSVAPGMTVSAARHSPHQENPNFNLPTRQNTDHYASSISSSILYESTPPPQKQAMQPPTLPPLPHSKEIPQMQSLTNAHTVYQQYYERANVPSSATSSVAIGEIQSDSAAAAPFITPVTTGTSIGTGPGPGVSSVSQPFIAQGKQQINDGKANQTTTEIGDYSSTFTADVNLPDHRPVSPVSSLNKVTSSAEVPVVTATTVSSSSQLAESPKSYAAELGIFASATGGLSGWGLYDDDDSMGNLSATTAKPGSSSALATKECESRNGNEETDGREAKDGSMISKDRVAELPHHTMPTRVESGGAMQQQLRRRTTESSVVSAISMPEASSSSPVPSRPPLIGRPSTPISIRDGLGNADGKSGTLQNEQRNAEGSAEHIPDISPGYLTQQKQYPAESSIIDSDITLPEDDAENRNLRLSPKQQKDGQSTNESEALMVFSEPLLGASPGKNEEDPDTNRDKVTREVINTSTVVEDTDRSLSDAFFNIKSSTSETSQKTEGQPTTSKALPEPNKSDEPARRTVYNDGLNSRSRASLHRCIGMLHEEADAASTDEKVKIFIDFVTVEAFIRGIDLSANLLSIQSTKDNDRKEAKEPSASPTSFNATTASDMAPVNIDTVDNRSHGNRSSPALGSKDSFDDLSQGYSPGGRPIIQKPPQPERAAPKLSTPVISQIISGRATALPESEEKIFVEHENWAENQSSHVHRLVDRNSSTRKRAATADVLAPIISGATKQNSGDSDCNSNGDTAVGVESGISAAAASLTTSAARSDVSSNTAIMTPPGSDVDEGTSRNEKKQTQQQQGQDQNTPPRPVSSALAYEPYTPVKNRLSMSPDTYAVSAAAASTGRKRESIPLYKVHEQEMSSVMGTGAVNRRVGTSDENRLSKVLSIVGPPIQMNAVENNNDDPNGGRQSGCESGSTTAIAAPAITTVTAIDSNNSKIPSKRSLPSLTILSALLPRKMSTRRISSPLLLNIWDEISSYPSLALSPISLACTPLTGGREIIKEKEFSWINDLYVSYNSQSTQIRMRLDIERQQRTEVAEQRTEQLFNDNEIGYADIGLREEEFRKEETENIAKECREDYARFTAEVFEPVYGKLQHEIGRLSWLAEYVRIRFLSERKDVTVNATGAVISYELALGLKALEVEELHGDASTNAPVAPTTDNSAPNPPSTSDQMIEPRTPSLDEALCLYFCIHDKIEGRQERLVQAIVDRDERYKKSVLEPLSYNSSVDYSKIGSNNAAKASVHDHSAFADANSISNSNNAMSSKKTVNITPKSSQQQIGQNKKMKQPQNPRLHSLEQHFASAAHSAAVRSAQDRHKRLMSILNSLSQSGSSAGNIIHRALEIAMTDTQRLTDAVKSVREEALAASTVTRNQQDGNGTGLREQTRAFKNDIGIGSSEFQRNENEREEKYGGNCKEASIQRQCIGNMGDGNSEGKNKMDYDDAAVSKQVNEGVDDDDDGGDAAEMTATQLVKRAYQAISILKEDSAQISSVMTMFRRNLLHASHLVRVCEGVVKADVKADHSEAEWKTSEKGSHSNQANGYEAVTNKINHDHDHDGKDDLATERRPSDFVISDEDDVDYRKEQEKLKKMEELKGEIGNGAWRS